MVVYAAKHGETALDGNSLNSPFATVLARVIKEPRIEVRKLFDIVRDDVWKATNARSSRSPTARCRAARIFTSWRGSDAQRHCEEPRTLSILMVRRRVSAVSNHVARGPSFETPLSRLLRMRSAVCGAASHTTTLSRFAARVMPV